MRAHPGAPLLENNLETRGNILKIGTRLMQQAFSKNEISKKKENVIIAGKIKEKET